MNTPSTLRSFHQAAWNEPLLHEQASPGERGFDPPATEPAIAERVGDGVSAIPPSLRRSAAAARCRSSPSPPSSGTSCASRRRRSARTSTSTSASARAR